MFLSKLIYLSLEVEILISTVKFGIRLTRKIIFSKLFPAFIQREQWNLTVIHSNIKKEGGIYEQSN